MTPRESHTLPGVQRPAALLRGVCLRSSAIRMIRMPDQSGDSVQMCRKTLDTAQLVAYRSFCDNHRLSTLPGKEVQRWQTSTE